MLMMTISQFTITCLYRYTTYCTVQSSRENSIYHYDYIINVRGHIRARAGVLAAPLLITIWQMVLFSILICFVCFIDSFDDIISFALSRHINKKIIINKSVLIFRFCQKWTFKMKEVLDFIYWCEYIN